jgi:hypothetical protein
MSNLTIKYVYPEQLVQILKRKDVLTIDKYVESASVVNGEICRDNTYIYVIKRENSSKTSEKRLFSLESTLNFGKYDGFKVKDVINVDSSYIEWCQDNVAWANFDKGVLDAIHKLKVSRSLYRLKLDSILRGRRRV